MLKSWLVSLQNMTVNHSLITLLIQLVDNITVLSNLTDLIPEII